MSDTNGRMCIIVTKGALDWAYPPFILASTAAAMDMDVTLFFTFYGLTLLKRRLDLRVSTLGNAAMEMPIMGGHMRMPPIVGMLPGMETIATSMMRKLIQKKGVAPVEQLRQECIEQGVKMIACQMILELFELDRDDLIDGLEYAGGRHLYRSGAWREHQSLHLTARQVDLCELVRVPSRSYSCSGRSPGSIRPPAASRGLAFTRRPIYRAA